MQFNFSNLNRIKAIVFDLGGVITNINYNLTVEAFRKLGINDFDKLYGQFKQTNTFDLFEKGLIEPKRFRDEIRALAGAQISDEDFDNAWYAMLLDTPKERIELIQRLRKNFKVYLLSNTNILHISRHKYNVWKETGIENFETLFDYPYYSYTAHMKKPDDEIYLKVLHENNLKPEETLFIDDTFLNTEAAERLGIQVYLLNDGKTINDLFKSY